MNYNSKLKQEKELTKISPLIRDLGYTPNFKMCGDKPDICIPSIENKEIGIEVTDYAERYYLKADSNKKIRGNMQLKIHNDFEKILTSYIRDFDKRDKDIRFYPKGSGYRICIWLTGGLLPFQEKIEDFKKIIFKEIDNYLFPANTFINNKFIAYAKADVIPNAIKSIFEYHLGFIECMTPVDDSVISEIIKEKNKKLLKYKECKDNESIKEYWLAICMPYRIQVVLEKYEVSTSIQTDYDRIYFVQDCKVWQIK